MASLCEGGNEPPDSSKANNTTEKINDQRSGDPAGQVTCHLCLLRQLSIGKSIRRLIRMTLELRRLTI
ncbi:hypothetical protein ANN_11664 [Periplaneta americana]|uniref:Uncharacterized protein n=1 Tax=Periplaneta americana TaxID=6978 RepID=A0ABQ8T5P7_PERAM|nr:hypothetical protein ANN_11664 [Periplaneta americana]